MIIIKIFIVNGKGFSGKSTVENMIVEIAAAHGKKVEILSTIGNDLDSYYQLNAYERGISW